MYVNAVSSVFNPYDIARIAGVRTRAEQPESRNQQATQQQERLIQGEVVSRGRLQNNNVSTTNDTLSNRRFNGQQSGYGFNSKQAINTYLSNQTSGQRIDQQINDELIIDVYV